MKTDQSLEQAALNFKLETRERVLQEAFDLGSLALNDIDRVKAQIDNFPFDFKWPQLMVTHFFNPLIRIIEIKSIFKGKE